MPEKEQHVHLQCWGNNRENVVEKTTNYFTLKVAELQPSYTKNICTIDGKTKITQINAVQTTKHHYCVTHTWYV